MDYIYIIVPIWVSLLLFILTVGYFLFVKHRTNLLLKSIRRCLILKRCDPEFAAKPPVVAIHPEPFIGVYRKPSIPVISQGYTNSPTSDQPGFNNSRSLISTDRNSDVIEIPFQSYLPSSSSTSAGINNKHYFRDEFQNNYEPFEENDDGGGILQYREYEFADEFGPNKTYEIQSINNDRPKFHCPY